MTSGFLDKPEMPDSAEQHPALEDELARVAEALLFASAEPLRPAQIADIFAGVGNGPTPTDEQVAEVVQALNDHYEITARAFRIEAWAGGYRLATVPSLSGYIEELLTRTQPKRLSRSLLETLAIIAYKQPVSKVEVDFIRGVDSDYAVRKLLELGLLDVAGRSESLGRPLLYETTQLFLDQFGLNALDDLPRLREIEEMMNDPSFNRERAKLLFTEGVQLPIEPDTGSSTGP